MRRFYFIAAIVETLLMGSILYAALRRRSDLDRAARRVFAGVAVFFFYALVAFGLVLGGIRTTQIMEVPQLVGTVAILAGFVAWQPGRLPRRLLTGLLAVYLIGWVVGVWFQGGDADFAPVTQPLQALSILIAAGTTLVTRTRVADERWSAGLWFWCSAGLMVVFGTHAIVEPLMINMFRVREDLVRLAYLVQVLCGCIGYGLILWGLWHTKRSRAVGTPLAFETGP